MNLHLYFLKIRSILRYNTLLFATYLQLTPLKNVKSQNVGGISVNVCLEICLFQIISYEYINTNTG